jgi:hypothetical protein
VSNEAGRQWRHDFGEYGVTLAGEVSRSVASARFRRSGAGKKSACGRENKRAHAGGSGKERESAVEEESTWEKGEHAHSQPCFRARRLRPCSRTRHPSSALVQPPPLLANGKRRTPAPLCSRVVFARCQGEDAAPARSCVCGCCLPPLAPAHPCMLLFLC